MNLYSSEWCDLIFEGRNKAYGAYVMRRTAVRRHLWAFIIVLIFFSFAVAIPILVDNILYNRYQQQEESVMVDQYQLLDAIMDENMLPELKKPVIPVQTDAAPSVTPKEEMAQTIKSNMLDIITSTPIENDPYLEELMQDEKPVEDKKDPAKEEPAPVDNQLYTVVDVMPSFPGGEAGLMEFLGKILRYPYLAKEKKMEKTVICCFFIEKDGSVKQPFVMQPDIPMFDREALRVIQSLPKWIPARKQGKPIRVKYILPINFRLK
ncbi:MAG TPA: TonB family protein [Bacteroidales bacterium]|nr:TonB family protein [Bacteroidales bacterium]